MKIRLAAVTLNIALLLFASCEKVVNVDLKDSDQKVIIEGEISDVPGLLQHTIMLSKTIKFSADNKRNPIVGATVVIKDETSNITDTLTEFEPGSYITSKILGTSGHSYLLSATVAGKTYTTKSVMPIAVELDSIYAQDFSFFGNTIKQIVPVFTDPAGVKNYYLMGVKVGDSVINNQDAWDDQLSDGKENSRPYNIFNTDLFKGNDTVIYTLKSIDKGTFDFYNTLENASGQGQTPANPTSNISGGALGYFSTSTIRKRSIIVP